MRSLTQSGCPRSRVLARCSSTRKRPRGQSDCPRTPDHHTARRPFRRFRSGPYPRLPSGHVSQRPLSIPDDRIPESGSGLGSARHFSGRAFLHGARTRCWRTPRPNELEFASPLRHNARPAPPSSASGREPAVVATGVPRTPSPERAIPAGAGYDRRSTALRARADGERRCGHEIARCAQARPRKSC